MENIIVNGIIYCYTCSANGKKYVGQTTNLKRRIRAHKEHNQKTGCSAFYRAIEKYGYDNFTFAILQEGITTREELDKLEGEYINKLCTLVPNGYNLKTGGGNVKHSEQSKKKASESAKKNWANAKYAKTQRKNTYDSPEWRRKVSEAAKKMWADDGYRNRQMAGMSKAGKNILPRIETPSPVIIKSSEQIAKELVEKESAAKLRNHIISKLIRHERSKLATKYRNEHPAYRLIKRKPKC